MEWCPESWQCALDVMLDVATVQEVPMIRTHLAAMIGAWPDAAGDISLPWMNATWDLLERHYPVMGHTSYRPLPLERVRNILGDDVPTHCVFAACIAPWEWGEELDAVFPFPYMPAEVELLDKDCCAATPSQKRALSIVLLEMSRAPEYRRHRSFILEGGAGVGKSWTVRTLVRMLNNRAIVTATTASAAQTLDIAMARTVHSTMGVGMGERADFMTLLNNLKTRIWNVVAQAMTGFGGGRRPTAHQDMMDALEYQPDEGDVMEGAAHPLWIIDEVSMMGAKLLDVCMRAWLATVFTVRRDMLCKHALGGLDMSRMERQNRRGLGAPHYATMYYPRMDRLNFYDVQLPDAWAPPAQGADASTLACYTSLWRTFYEHVWRYMPPILFVGDFFQLPPVNDDYAFESAWWTDQLVPTRLPLIEPVRQQGDLAYHAFLEKLRMGKLSTQEMMRWWSQFQRASKEQVPETATYLHARNKDADETNANKLAALRRTVYVVRALDEGDTASGAKHFNVSLPEVVELSVGAQIILRRNMDQGLGLVNGTRATILGIGRIHSSQIRYGATMSDGSAAQSAMGSGVKGYTGYSLSLPFRPGQYTWLDHAEPERMHGKTTSAESRVALNAPETFVEIETMRERRRIFILSASIKMTRKPPRKNAKKRDAEDDEEEIVAQRIQMPMILGWAVSIHRSQGMTLVDGAHIDARGLFAPGQGYVAFSRVPSASLVHLVNTPSGMGTRPAPKVVQYYASLPSTTTTTTTA